MPFLKKIITGSGIIGLWELTETSSQMEEIYRFKGSEANQFGLITAERRRKEFLSVRLLLQELLNNETEIEYEKNGRPRLRNFPLQLSISHSQELAVIFLSEKTVGIDIESLDRNIAKVATRFLSEQEFKFTRETGIPDRSQIICWCAKEAVYKCAMESNVQFNTDIILTPFHPLQEGSMQAWFKKEHLEKSYRLFYTFIRNNVMVYCVEE